MRRVLTLAVASRRRRRRGRAAVCRVLSCVSRLPCVCLCSVKASRLRTRRRTARWCASTGCVACARKGKVLVLVLVLPHRLPWPPCPGCILPWWHLACLPLPCAALRWHACLRGCAWVRLFVSLHTTQQEHERERPVTVTLSCVPCPCLCPRALARMQRQLQLPARVRRASHARVPILHKVRRVHQPRVPLSAHQGGRHARQLPLV